VLLFAVAGKAWNWSEPLHVGVMQREPTMAPPLLELLEAPDDEEAEPVDVPDDELDPVDDELALVWPPPDDDDPGPAPDEDEGPTPAPDDDDPEPFDLPPEPGSPLPFELEQAARRSRPRPTGRARCIMPTSLGKPRRTPRSYHKRRRPRASCADASS
jgi:hypothetical protein